MPKPHQAPVLLLVEDQDALQLVLDAALTDEGFEVVIAKSGTAAIKKIEEDAGHFKAVITDIKLGRGPSGWDVGHRAREIVPGIPVIYMSSDSAQDWSANGVPESIMLQKPFVMAQLVTAVTTLLNQFESTAALSEAMREGKSPPKDK